MCVCVCVVTKICHWNSNIWGFIGRWMMIIWWHWGCNGPEGSKQCEMLCRTRTQVKLNRCKYYIYTISELLTIHIYIQIVNIIITYKCLKYIYTGGIIWFCVYCFFSLFFSHLMLFNWLFNWWWIDSLFEN